MLKAALNSNNSYAKDGDYIKNDDYNDINNSNNVSSVSNNINHYNHNCINSSAQLIVQIAFSLLT